MTNLTNTFVTIPVKLSDQEVLPSSTILHDFSTCTIDTRALSVEVVGLASLDDHLKHRIRAIAGDNGAILDVYHSAADYTFATKVAKEVWPRYIDREIKTNVASMTLSVLDTIVARNVNTGDKRVQLVISAMMAEMLNSQGLLSLELPEISVRIPKNVFPTFAMMKHEALVKATYDRIKAIDIEKAMHTNTTGALALKPFAEVFAKYSHIFRDIELLGDKLDAYGAALILKLFDMDSSMGPLRGVLNNTSLDRGIQNYTLVNACMDHFLGTDSSNPSIGSLISTLSIIGTTQIVDSFQESSLLLSEPEVFQERSLKSIPSLISIYRFVNNQGVPIGYVAQPNFKGKSEGLDISEYYESDRALNNLEPDTLSEAHLSPLVTDLYDALRTIGKSITPLISRVMLNSNGAAEDQSYQPIALHISMSSQMVDHIAAAYSNKISFAYTEGEVKRAYVFPRAQRDDNFVLGQLSPEVAYASDPMLTILFSGNKGVEEATGVWEVGEQTLPDRIRPTRYKGEDFFDGKLDTIDLLNDKDSKLTRIWNITANVPTGNGGVAKHSIKTSLYELYSSSEKANWLRNDRYPIAHSMPLLSEQVSDVVDLYLTLSKMPKLPGYVQTPKQVATMQFTNLIIPIVKNSTFRRFLQSIKFKLLAEASSKTLEQRLALQNHMQTTDIDSKLAGELLVTILLRLGLIDFDQSKEVKTQLMDSSEFYAIIRPHLLAD